MARSSGLNWGTLIPRFLLAVVFVFHGGQKLFGLFGGEGIDGLAKGIEAWDWPMPLVLARAAAAAEFFGGICLALGLLTRFFALSLAVVMAVAVWKVHGGNGFSLQGGGWEYNFVLGVLALSLVIQGGGALSMDEMFFKGKRKPPKPAED
jgi:putative oxidoreductase